VTLLGAILGDIESLTCGTTDLWDPHVSDSMSPRMAPSNVTESQSTLRMEKLPPCDPGRQLNWSVE
jgi:hypothetical protein